MTREQIKMEHAALRWELNGSYGKIRAVEIQSVRTVEIYKRMKELRDMLRRLDEQERTQ